MNKMTRFLNLSLFCLLPLFSMAQIDPTWGYVTAEQAGNLKRSVQTEKNDTLKMAAFRSLGFYYQAYIPDSAVYFHEKQLALSKKLNMNLWQADAYSQAGETLALLGNLMKAYEYHTEAMKLAGDEKNESDNWRPWTFSNATNGHEARIAILGMNYLLMGNLMGIIGEVEKQKNYYREAVKLGETINNGKIISISSANLASDYSPGSLIVAENKSLKIAAKAGYNRVGGRYLNIANAYLQKGKPDSAMIFAHRSIAGNKADNDLRQLWFSYAGISALFSLLNNKDSSLFYAKKALETAQLYGTPNALAGAYQNLASRYTEINKTDSSFKYLRLYSGLNDSLNKVRITSLKNYQKTAFNEQLRLKKMDEEKTAYANNLKMIGLLAVLGGILVVAFILYRNNRQKQKANKVLETTLTNLKSTQSQLIQSEKMASLGELTAGIAHEIQNPLNFVNNFSEINTELIEEMKVELKAGNKEDAIALANDIADNEQKINHHGKRAGDIVKGMLQHSRNTSNATKEPTDINKLADEYLRLAYHGLRAKDKLFNATMKTDFDDTIGNINIISQGIGRVILNLITNAFYVVDEKKKSGIEGYEPTVSVSTKKSGDKVLISVSDNGKGIPEKILDKIFQPFFTTKPTGQGTGLGLSLSYDIVKAHGGELKVETIEGAGTTFIIRLPI